MNSDLIERIARHADIDTRRALGFGDIDLRIKLGFHPGKVVIPELNLPFESEYSDKIQTVIRFRNAVLYIYHPYESTAWIFDTYGYYSFYRRRGDIVIHTEQGVWENLRHPDINEDGKLRAWRA